MPKNIQTASLLVTFQQDLGVLLEATPSSIVVFDLEGKILAANDSAARMFGRADSTPMGRNIYATFVLDGEMFETHVLKVAETHDIYAFEGVFKGRAISCILYPILNARGGVIRIALMAQDNTDRRRAEEQVRVLTQELERKVVERTAELQKTNQQLLREKKRAELLAEFSRVLVEYAYDYGGLLQHISDEIAQQIGDTCIIGIFSAGGSQLQTAAVSHRTPEIVRQMRAVLEKKSFPIEHVGLGSLMLQKEVYVGEQLSHDQTCALIPPDLWPIIDKAGLRGLAGIPLLVSENVLGGIFVARDDPQSLPYDTEEIAFLQGIAGPLALTIENARLFDEIKQNRQELRGLSQKLVSSQEDQFQRLGKELHDHIGQDLTAININLSLIENMLPADVPEGLRPRLADANRLVEESVAHMRNIMSDFLPPMLDRYGLTAALLWYTQKLTARTNLPITVNDTCLRALRLPREVETGLFRITQEALNNVIKYAQAGLVEIELRDEDGFILMTLKDNGRGFDPQAIAAGREEHWGLAIMRERARAIDATFNIQSAPGLGTQIILRIPRTL